MPNIQVQAIGDNQFEVTVTDRSSTRHIVTVPPEYAQKLTSGKIKTELLIEKSFVFLLEREPNTSILRSFELSVIARYFGEYEHEIRQMI